MEILNQQVIIDSKFKPDLDQGYLEYFSRAMKFAQTNYSMALEKHQRTNFNTLSPVSFFEEYVWLIYCLDDNVNYFYSGYPVMAQQLSSFYRSFTDWNYFPNEEEIDESLNIIFPNAKKKKSVAQTARIISRGIKLFEWKYYRNNYLNTAEKLIVFPLLEVDTSLRLAKNIGIDALDDRLHLLANHFGFINSRVMCDTIHKNVPLRLKVVELILWYAVAHFEPHLLKS